MRTSLALRHYAMRTIYFYFLYINLNIYLSFGNVWQTGTCGIYAYYQNTIRCFFKGFWLFIKGSMTHLQTLQISITFILQVASD